MVLASEMQVGWILGIGDSIGVGYIVFEGERCDLARRLGLVRTKKPKMSHWGSVLVSEITHAN